LINRGEKAVREITMAKLFCSELDQKVMYDCMQIMGGFAYTTEYPIGRAWRDARLNTIGAGASEIMKEIKLALQECGRRLDAYLRRGYRAAEAQRKKDYIRSYLPHIGIGLREILGFKESEQKKVLALLTDILEKSSEKKEFINAKAD
jgi:tRNA A37 methylthiotransferase MiaB